MTIEQQLKELRLSMGLNKADFAKKTGIHASTITQYERRQLKISKITIDKVNKALGTNFKVEIPCADCGKVFEPQNKGYKYCPDCTGKKVYTYPKRKKPEQPKMSIAEFNEQARERKMTYGQLQAEMYKRGGANIGII